MATNKTLETAASVTEFVNAVADETKRNDSFRLIKLIGSLTGFPPKLWGTSIIGFGNHHYKYDSGHEGDMPLVSFSPRATALVLYLSMASEQRVDLLQKLGKHKAGKGCIYIKKLDDVDLDVLKEMITASVQSEITAPSRQS